MIVKNINEGTKIPYTIDENRITFNDELMLNVEKYERDDDNHIDICRDAYGNLVTGVIPGLAMEYVAQIDIPARMYARPPQEEPYPLAEGEQSISEAVPLNMNKCTLTLWTIE